MNLVIIMTDTQCKDMVGAYGRPEMDTPNLDRLATGGVRFDNAYTACPVCTPARSAIFSGLTPQVNGAWDIGRHEWGVPAGAEASPESSGGCECAWERRRGKEGLGGLSLGALWLAWLGRRRRWWLRKSTKYP